MHSKLYLPLYCLPLVLNLGSPYSIQKPRSYSHSLFHRILKNSWALINLQFIWVCGGYRRYCPRISCQLSCHPWLRNLLFPIAECHPIINVQYRSMFGCSLFISLPLLVPGMFGVTRFRPTTPRKTWWGKQIVPHFPSCRRFSQVFPLIYFSSFIWGKLFTLKQNFPILTHSCSVWKRKYFSA